jgi:hypothetical protein
VSLATDAPALALHEGDIALSHHAVLAEPLTVAALVRTSERHRWHVAVTPLAVRATPDPGTAIVAARFFRVRHVARTPGSFDAVLDARAASVAARLFDRRDDAGSEIAVLTALRPLAARVPAGDLFPLDRTRIGHPQARARAAARRRRDEQGNEGKSSALEPGFQLLNSSQTSHTTAGTL